MIPKHPQYGAKGGQSRNYEQMMLFYDPEDFEKVAQGRMEPGVP